MLDPAVDTRAEATGASWGWPSIGGVEKHIANIFAKLGLAPSGNDHRRVLAVLAYPVAGLDGLTDVG